MLQKIATEKRTLAPGYKWQDYAVYAIRPVSKEEYDTHYKKREFYDQAHAQWQDKVIGFIEYRCKQLGMVVEELLYNTFERPNEADILETSYWDQSGAVYIWSLWAYIQAPVHGDLWQPSRQPVIGFWPGDNLSMKGHSAVIHDVSVLSQIESTAAPR